MASCFSGLNNTKYLVILQTLINPSTISNLTRNSCTNQSFLGNVIN